MYDVSSHGTAWQQQHLYDQFNGVHHLLFPDFPYPWYTTITCPNSSLVSNHRKSLEIHIWSGRAVVSGDHSVVMHSGALHSDNSAAHCLTMQLFL